MIHDGKLEKFTIIRLDKYDVRPQVDSLILNSIIVLLEVSVVQPGCKVGDKFGSPQNEIPFEASFSRILPIEVNDGEEVQANKISLTRGALASICAGEHVPHPTLQVLEYKHHPSGMYRFLLSDGEHKYSGAILPADTPMINLMLEKFTIIRVVKYDVHPQVVSDSPLLNSIIILREVSVVQPGYKVGDKFDIPQNQIPFEPQNEIPLEVKNDQPLGKNLENGQHEVNDGSSNIENDGPDRVNEGGKDFDNDGQNKVSEGTKDQAKSSNLENYGQVKRNEGRKDQSVGSNLENDGQQEENEVENDKKKKKIKPKCARASCENQGRHRCSPCKAVYYCQQECLEEDWSHHKMYCDYVYKANKVPHDSNSKDTEEMENKDTEDGENSEGREEVENSVGREED